MVTSSDMNTLIDSRKRLPMQNSNAHYQPVVGPDDGARRLHVHVTELHHARDGWGYQHSHEAEEAIYMLEGEGEFTFDGKTHRVGPGQAVFFPSGVTARRNEILQRQREVPRDSNGRTGRRTVLLH